MIPLSDRSTAFTRLLPLLKTLFDIVLLRKGPEQIPPSGIVFLMAVLLWLLSALSALALIDRYDDRDFFLSLFSGLVGLLCYAVIVAASGRLERLTQTLAAIVGVGAVITLIFVAEYALFRLFLGEVSAGLVGTLILFWSVPVEGHIIARAIDRHWYIGIMVAVGVFSLQYFINIMITDTP